MIISKILIFIFSYLTEYVKIKVKVKNKDSWFLNWCFFSVIPLDDLPELQVGYGFGLVDKENIPKPAYLKDIKLITSANKHRFIVPGGVKQLTKEEFEAFTNQV